VAAEPQDQFDEPEMRKLPVAVCNGQLRRSSLRQAVSKAKKESPEVKLNDKLVTSCKCFHIFSDEW